VRHGQFPHALPEKVVLFVFFGAPLLLKMPSSSDQKKKINDRCNSRK
jgi:hypothetical protein